jgi:hypothetical protein
MDRKENWRAVKGWEGLYEVSDLGRVRSLPRVVPKKDGKFYTCKGGLLNQFKSHDYYVVRLRYCAGGLVEFVHRLVAEAFVPNPNAYPIVNHKDEDTYNNIPSNLEWCTNLYNLNYGGARERAINTLKRKYRTNEIQSTRSIMVELYDTKGELKYSFSSLTDAAKFIGRTNPSNIRKMLRKNKIYKGYIWKFIKK